MKYSKYGLLIGSFFVMALAVGIAIFSPARGVLKAADLSLEDKFSQFIDSQNQFTAALQKAMEQPVKVPVQTALLPAQGSNGPVPHCYDDYLSWNSSTTYKVSNWDPNFAQNSSSANNYTVNSLFTDLNGDGLSDYLYTNTWLGSVLKSCVFLNTGTGWTRVYKCYGETQNSVWTFYGDCAA